MQTEDLDYLVTQLKKEINSEHIDPSEIHEYYIAIMHHIAWNANPKIVAELDELTRDIEY